ncbi:MAG: hypothetical protein ACM3U1_12430 [Chloroflexota bacterium]
MMRTALSIVIALGVAFIFFKVMMLALKVTLTIATIFTNIVFLLIVALMAIPIYIIIKKRLFNK